MEPESLGLLIAYCVALTVNAVHQPYSRLNALDFADKLATSLDLDMTGHWWPTARSYFGRVTKGHIVDAVRDAVSDEAAERLTGLKKLPMAEAAEQLVIGTGWLQVLLRTPVAAAPKLEPLEGDAITGIDEGPALSEAAE